MHLTIQHEDDPVRQMLCECGEWWGISLIQQKKAWQKTEPLSGVYDMMGYN